jgi:hypothetical protein
VIALRRYGLHTHSSFIHLQGMGSWTMRENPCPSPIAADSGIDIWHGAGPPAHPEGARSTGRAFRGRGPNMVCDVTVGSPSWPRPDVPFCAAGRMATAVVLARRSVPTELAAERGSACSSAGAGSLPCLLQLPAH